MNGNTGTSRFNCLSWKRFNNPPKTLQKNSEHACWVCRVHIPGRNPAQILGFLCKQHGSAGSTETQNPQRMYVGHTEFILALGYKADLIRNFFSTYQTDEDWKINCIDTGLNTETGGRIKQAMKFAGHHRVMATYGDGLANIDISKLIFFPSLTSGKPEFFNKDKKAFSNLG